MKTKTLIASIGALGVVGGSLALLSPSATARTITIGDGAANVVLQKCSDGVGQTAARLDGCSYNYLKPKTSGGKGYTYPTSQGQVTWNNGNVTAGALKFPAADQTWPQVTGLPLGTTADSVPKEITGKIDTTTNKVTINLDFEVLLTAPTGKCSLTGSTVLTSDATDSLGGGTGKAYDPATGDFAVANAAIAPLTPTGAGCGSLGLLYDVNAGMGWYLHGKMGLPGGATPTPEPTTPTPTPTPTTPTQRKKQKPVKPLNLPAKLANSGDTRIVKVPVKTNAKQNARVTVTGTPINSAAAGEVRAFRTFKRGGAVWVNLSGTQATKVTVRITAPRTKNYTAYATKKVYRTKAVG